MTTIKTTGEAFHLLATAVRNVMTDEQLDAPVPAAGGMTTRQVLRDNTTAIAGMLDAIPARGAAAGVAIKAYWHPRSNVIGSRKYNAEWEPLVPLNYLPKE